MASDMKTIAGVTGFSVSTASGPSRRFSVADTANFRASGEDREVLMGAQGPAGVKVVPVVGFVEVGCYDQQDLSFDEIGRWGEVTAHLVTRSGKILICTGVVVSNPEVSAMDGTFTLRIEGRCTEVRA